MAVIFQTRPGYVTAVADPDDAGFPLAVDGARSWFTSLRAIVCELSVALDGNYQVTHTLKDVLYVYAYGGRIGKMQLSGLAFAGACGSSGQPGGIELLTDYYAANAVYARATPLSIQIGAKSSGRFKGILVGYRAHVVKPEARIAQFAMSLEIFPDAAKAKTKG